MLWSYSNTESSRTAYKSDNTGNVEVQQWHYKFSKGVDEGGVKVQTSALWEGASLMAFCGSDTHFMHRPTLELQHSYFIAHFTWIAQRQVTFSIAGGGKGQVKGEGGGFVPNKWVFMLRGSLLKTVHKLCEVLKGSEENTKKMLTDNKKLREGES